MGKKNYFEKLQEGEKECEKIWIWLKDNTQYRKDFADYKQTEDYLEYIKSPIQPVTYIKQLKDPKRFRQKWGFYPLVNPTENFPLSCTDIFEQICELFMGDSPEFIVIVKGPGNSTIPPFPLGRKTLTLDIDIDKPIDSILAALKYEIEKRQKLLGIDKKSFESRFSNLSFTYQMFVYLNLGWNEIEIKKLAKKIPIDERGSYLKKINRCLTKAKTVIEKLKF